MELGGQQRIKSQQGNVARLQLGDNGAAASLLHHHIFMFMCVDYKAADVSGVLQNISALLE